MSADTATSLSVRLIHESDLQNNTISEAIEQAKVLYWDDIFYVLVSPVAGKEELAFRPEMAKFMADTSIQIMKISDLDSMKDTFDCHNTITLGKTRSQWGPGKSFYNIVIGSILAINPDAASLEKFSVQK